MNSDFRSLLRGTIGHHQHCDQTDDQHGSRTTHRKRPRRKCSLSLFACFGGAPWSSTARRSRPPNRSLNLDRRATLGALHPSPSVFVLSLELVKAVVALDSDGHKNSCRSIRATVNFMPDQRSGIDTTLKAGPYIVSGSRVYTLPHCRLVSILNRINGF